MSANVLRRSFAGGEIAPEMFGRLDLSKFQTGLALTQNAIILPHGPAQRRPGTRFVLETKDSTTPTRVIPFEFSVDQTAALVFGHQTLRFCVEGETLLEANQTVSGVVGSTVTMSAPHSWTTGDDVFIGGLFARITVTGATQFTVADRWGVAITFTGTPTTAARVYTIATPYDSADLFGLVYSQDNDVLTLTHGTYEAKELRRLGAANWTLTAVSFAPSLAPPTGVGVVATVPTSTNLSPQEYVVTAVGADGVAESLASTAVTTSNNLTLAGNYNTVSWTAGAARFNVYKKRGGAFGFIGQTSSTSVVDDNVTPDTTRTPPEDLIDLNATAGEYPVSVTHHEQRRWFGGTVSAPQTVWATRSGTSSNLTSSVPSQDDDALNFRLASQKQNAIRFLLPLSDLIALTAGGIFRLFADNAPVIVPTALSIKPQGYAGAAQVQPALTNASILYVQNKSAHVREIAYNWQSSAFAAVDLSLFAPHLFDGFQIVDMAYAQSSIPVLWCVRNDGVLLGMTYVPEHQVYAWHQHTTDGVIESVCAISENSDDGVYVVVLREIDGRSVRYVERLADRLYFDQKDGFFVDCGATYDGAPTTTLSGLWHLEGEEVQIATDGGPHPVRTVVDGAIALEAEASVVHVGLAYSTRIQTLPLAFESAPAAGVGSTKNVNGVAIRVDRSNAVTAGPSFDDLVSYPGRDVLDLVGVAPPLRSEEMRFEIAADWNADGQVCIEQTQPLPLTVLSIALDVAGGS